MTSQVIARRIPRGAVAVEFALVAPLILVLLFGIVEFGVMMYNQAVITNAAREGARWGAVQSAMLVPQPVNCSTTGLSTLMGSGCSGTGTASSACQVASNYSTNYLITFGSGSPPTITVSCVTPSNGTSTAAAIQVQVSYSYAGLGFLGLMGSSGASALSSTSVMYLE